MRNTFYRSMLRTLPLLALLLQNSLACASSSDFDNVKMKVTKAAGNVYMLQGNGGNIGVLASQEGLILIDDEFAPLAQRIEAAMQGIASGSLKYVINTHFHGDHTGSNTFFAAKAPIIAHSKVRERLLHPEEGEEAVALPVLTFEQGVNLYLADEEVQLTHLPAGHTDGDTAVYFKRANVLHTGDLFFEIGFPYIDLQHGGTVRGYLADVQYLIDHTPDDVVIIPGHGKLANKARYREFAAMIRYSIDRVSAALAAGKSEQQILADGIGQDYEHWAWSFINEEKWLKTLIRDLQKSH